MNTAFAVEVDQSRLLRFLGYRLTRAELHVHKLFRCSVGAFDLKPSEFAILTLLASNPGIYLQQLGETLDISPPNLVPVIERLVRRALVLRRPDARDRRLQQLHLTPEGQTLQIAAATEVEQLEQQLEQALSPAEQKHLVAALEKLSKRASEKGG